MKSLKTRVPTRVARAGQTSIFPMTEDPRALGKGAGSNVLLPGRRRMEGMTHFSRV